MGEFKVPGLLSSIQNAETSKKQVWLISSYSLKQVDIGYVYDEPGKLVQPQI